MRNAIGPVLPMLAIDAGTAITAAIYVETVFGLSGLGTLAVTAFSGQAGGYDLPLTAGIVVTVGAFVVLLNIAADVAGAWIDPRTREREARGLIPVPAAVAARPRVQRGLSLAVVAAGLVLLALFVGLGRGKARSGIELGTPVRTLHVNWSDAYPAPGPAALATHVSRIDLGVYGWRVRATIANRSSSPVPVENLQVPPAFGGGPPGPQPYPNQPISLLVRGPDRYGSIILQVYEAKQFDPPLPATLKPHETWRGTFAGTGKVKTGSLFYVGFGQFTLDNRPISFSSEKSATAP